MFTVPEHFWVGVTGSVVYGVLGLFFLLGGFKLFDLITQNLDIEKRLNENPIATGITVAGFFIALALIISSVVQ